MFASSDGVWQRNVHIQYKWAIFWSWARFVARENCTLLRYHKNPIDITVNVYIYTSDTLAYANQFKLFPQYFEFANGKKITAPLHVRICTYFACKTTQICRRKKSRDQVNGEPRKRASFQPQNGNLVSSLSKGAYTLICTQILPPQKYSSKYSRFNKSIKMRCMWFYETIC